MFGASFASSAVNIARKSMTEINAILTETGRLQGPLDAKKAEEYEQAMGRAVNAITGLQRAVADKLLPEITHASDATTAWLASINKDDVGKGVIKFIHDLKEEISGLQPALDLMQTVADKLNALRASGHETERSGEGVKFNVPKFLAEHGWQGPSDLLAGDRSYGDSTSQLTATGGLPTASPQQNIPDIGSMLKPIKPGQFAVGADEIRQPGLAFVHEGEQIRPAESNGPYRAGDASPFQAAHSAENRRSVDENTSKIAELNAKLQKLLDGDTADGTAGAPAADCAPPRPAPAPPPSPPALPARAPAPAPPEPRPNTPPVDWRRHSGARMAVSSRHRCQRGIQPWQPHSRRLRTSLLAVLRVEARRRRARDP
jgi:hypothetical protein